MVKKKLYGIFAVGVMQVTLLYADEAMPSIELLEYLAEMESTDGEWVDVLDMKEMAKNEQTDKFLQEQGNE